MKYAGITLLFAAISAVAQPISAIYSSWLSQDVTYIVTGQERSAFLRLQTDAERDQLIEQFWLRRDPTPDTIENEFREEHYRRIAYANEYFGSSIPGWKTDRGRIYITYGAPDMIQSFSAIQKWTYSYIDGVGTNVSIEFVDPTGSGEFHMTMEPAGKQPLLYMPKGAQTMMEQMGMSDKTQRFNGDSAEPVRGDGGPKLPEPLTPRTAPKTRFPDLEARIYSRITYSILPMKVRVDFFPVTNATVLTYVTVQFDNQNLDLQNKGGVLSAHVRMFGEFTTLLGRVVETFEEDMQIPAPPREDLKDWAERKSLGQRSVPLRPGTYRLVSVCSDDVARRTNNYETTITVPEFDASTPSTSSLILADALETVPMRNIGSGEFIIGDTKVRPRLGGRFRQDESLGVYMTVYNLGKVQGQAEYQVARTDTGEVVVNTTEDIAKIPNDSASQVTLQKLLRLEKLSPGSYTLQVRIATIEKSAPFTVTVR